MADQVIASLVGRLSFEVDAKGLREFGKHLGEAEEESKRAKGRFGDLDAKLGELATGFAKRLPAAIATGVAALGTLAVVVGTKVTASFIESGAELDKWARKMGTTTQEIQRLEFAGASVGAEADNVREAFKTLTENLGELERVGSGPAVDSLATLGLTLEDFKGKDATEQMGLFADAMQRLPNDAQRVSVALEVMGEDGGALLPLFQKGSQGIEELAQKADRLGVVLDDNAIDAAKSAKLAIGELTAQATGLANQIGAKLAPKVTEAIGRIQGWYEANKTLIDQKIDRFIDDLVPALERVVEIGTGLVETGGNLIGMFGGLEGAVVAAGVAAGGLAIAFGGLPAIIAATTAAIVLGTGELGGFREEVSRLRRERDALLGQAARDKETGKIAIDLAARAREGTLSQLSDEEFDRQLAQLESSGERVRSRVTGEWILKTDVRGDTPAKQMARRFERQRAAEQERARKAAPAPTIDMAGHVDALLRGKLEARARKLGLGQQAVETSIGRARMSLTEGATLDAAAETAMTSLEGLAGVSKKKGGKTKIDTAEAESQLGTQIRALAQGAGATSKATQKALESAAQSLKGGAAQSVALQAATATLESLTGQKLAAAGGPDAALFGMLTQIGGAQAARTATEGARFVRIDQSVNIDVGGVELTIPEEWAGMMAERGAAPAMAEALRQLVVEQVFAPIVERAQARGERP